MRTKDRVYDGATNANGVQVAILEALLDIRDLLAIGLLCRPMHPDANQKVRDDPIYLAALQRAKEGITP